MRISSRSKVSVVLSFVALIAFVSAFAVYGLGTRGTVHAAPASSSTKATRGHITYVGKVNPLALAKVSAKSGAQAKPASIPLRLPPGVKTANTARGHVPSANSISTTRVPPLHNFDGINSTQSLNVAGTSLEPPDEGLAFGNGLVFNLVNAAGAFYHQNGTLVSGPFSLSGFFGEQPVFTNGTLTFDPRAYFDASTNTWFALASYFDDGSVSGHANSHFDLAVNSSGNPLTAWTIYRIDTTALNDNGCPCYGDYPQFGIDQYNVYVSTNEFSISGPAYNGAQIYAISKSQLEALATSVNYVHFGNLSIGGSISYHVQPAIEYTNGPAEYFMDSLDPNGTFDNRIGVWAMTDRNTVTTGHGMPNLSSTVITSEAYGFPVNAVTPPGFNGSLGQATTGLIQADFDAMQEVEYINGHLVGALDTAITIPGDTSTRDGVAWFQVQPVLAGKVISPKTSILNQGYVADSGNYLLYPHINENWQGNMAMVFTLGGPNTYLSAAYAYKPSYNKQFNAVHIAAAGSEPDNGFTAVGGAGRWGDYSNGELAPNGNFWFATEYIPSNGDQFANWGNRIFEVNA